MKKIFYLILLLAFVSIVKVSAQENRSRFGIEVGAEPWEYDSFSGKTPFSIGTFVGIGYEHFFSNPFSLKTSIGLNNVNYKTGFDWFPNKVERKWHTMIKLSAEPRYYCWGEQQKWGNLFISLPISIETGPFQNNTYGNIFQSMRLRTIGAVGYQYYFNSHWYAEVNAGLGWSHQFYSKGGIDQNNFDYQLSALFGYSF